MSRDRSTNRAYRAAEREAEAVLERGSDLTLTRRLAAYIGGHKLLFFVALALYPLSAMSVALPPALVQRILDEAIPARDMSMLQMLAALYLGALVLEYATGFTSQLVMSVLGHRAMRTLRADLFAHVQRLPASFFDKNPIGRVLTRLTNDVEALAEVFSTGAVTIIADAVTVIFIVGMMLWLDVRLTLFAFLVVPPLVALAVVFQRFARRAFRAIRKHMARINGFLSEHIVGMAAVQIFLQEQRTQQEFAALNRAYRDANRQAILFDALLYASVEAIGTCAVAAMMWYGAMDLSTGVVGAGTLVAFIQYIRRFFVPIRDLSMKYTIMQSAFAAAERVFHLLDEDVTVASGPQPKSVQGLRHGLELDDVWFAYRGSGSDVSEGEWVLRGLSLRVRRGERVALVGATGSGKTTILRLLNRFYDVQRGAVRVDGTDVRELDLAQLRRLYAVVLQDVYLFSGTVMDNLAFSDSVTAEQVRRASAAVGADAFVQRLADGYGAHVQEQGQNFSAGERQLLALARALAMDPEVLILDEATSNVDSETEQRIQQALDVVLRGRTALVVAHRLATIRKVDRILVIRQGELVEEGDHESLMRQQGYYRTLVDLQFGQAQMPTGTGA